MLTELQRRKAELWALGLHGDPRAASAPAGSLGGAAVPGPLPAAVDASVALGLGRSGFDPRGLPPLGTPPSAQGLGALGHKPPEPPIFGRLGVMPEPPPRALPRPCGRRQARAQARAAVRRRATRARCRGWTRQALCSG